MSRSQGATASASGLRQAAGQRPGAMAWSDEDDERLQALWAEGLSGMAIGKAMGRTKSACLGRAHRLELVARPSPIPTGSRMTGAAGVVKAVARVEAKAAAPEPERAPPGRPRQRLSLWLVSTGIVRECQWPHGTPGTKSFRFCEAASFPGRPYCFTHSQLAYIGFGRPRATDNKWVP